MINFKLIILMVFCLLSFSAITQAQTLDASSLPSPLNGYVAHSHQKITVLGLNQDTQLLLKTASGINLLTGYTLGAQNSYSFTLNMNDLHSHIFTSRVRVPQTADMFAIELRVETSGLKTALYVVTDCDYLAHYDPNPVKCADGSTCVLTGKLGGVIVPGYCQCQPDVLMQNQYLPLSVNCSHSPTSHSTMIQITKDWYESKPGQTTPSTTHVPLLMHTEQHGELALWNKQVIHFNFTNLRKTWQDENSISFQFLGTESTLDPLTTYDYPVTGYEGQFPSTKAQPKIIIRKDGIVRVEFLLPIFSIYPTCTFIRNKLGYTSCPLYSKSLNQCGSPNNLIANPNNPLPAPCRAPVLPTCAALPESITVNLFENQTINIGPQSSFFSDGVGSIISLTPLDPKYAKLSTSFALQPKSDGTVVFDWRLPERYYSVLDWTGVIFRDDCGPVSFKLIFSTQGIVVPTAPPVSIQASFFNHAFDVFLPYSSMNVPVSLYSGTGIDTITVKLNQILPASGASSLTSHRRYGIDFAERSLPSYSNTKWTLLFPLSVKLGDSASSAYIIIEKTVNNLEYSQEERPASNSGIDQRIIGVPVKKARLDIQLGRFSQAADVVYSHNLLGMQYTPGFPLLYREFFYSIILMTIDINQSQINFVLELSSGPSKLTVAESFVDNPECKSIPSQLTFSYENNILFTSWDTMPTPFPELFILGLARNEFIINTNSQSSGTKQVSFLIDLNPGPYTFAFSLSNCIIYSTFNNFDQTEPCSVLSWSFPSAVSNRRLLFGLPLNPLFNVIATSPTVSLANPLDTLALNALDIKSTSILPPKAPFQFEITTVHKFSKTCLTVITTTITEDCSTELVFSLIRIDPITPSSESVVIYADDFLYENYLPRSINVIAQITATKAISSNGPYSIPLPVGAITLDGSPYVQFDYLATCSIPIPLTVRPVFLSPSTIQLNDDAFVFSLKWLPPAERHRLYELSSTLPQILFQFTLHINNDPSPLDETKPLLDLNLIPNDAEYMLLEGIPNAGGTVAVAELHLQAYFSILLIPQTILEHGFYIKMSPINPIPEHGYGPVDDIKYYTALWQVAGGALYNNCQCLSGECDLSGKCIPADKTKIAMAAPCAIQCPPLMDRNNDCSGCICTTPQCIRNTHRIQINLESTDIPLSEYISAGSYPLKTLERNLIKHIGIQQYSVTDYRYYTYGTIPAANLAVPFSPPIGMESLQIDTINPSINFPMYIENVIITITNHQNGSIEAVKKRMEYLVNIIDTLIKTKPNLVAKNRYLPFNLNFKLNQSPIKSFPTQKITAGTQCSSIDGAFGSCPGATPKIVQTSQFWDKSKCVDSPTTSVQKLTVHCIDYNNQRQTSPWCVQGFPSYPLVSELPCPTDPTLVLESINIKFTPNGDINPGSIILIEWDWNTQFGTKWTVDVLFTSQVSRYSTLLGTFAASLRSAHVTIPFDLFSTLQGSTLESSVYIRMTQKASIVSDPISLTISRGYELCAATNPCGTDPILSRGKVCAQLTGHCVCDQGYVTQFDEELNADICTLPCDGYCPVDQCTPEKPTQCQECPDGMIGLLCEIPAKCGNRVQDGLNESCSLHGYRSCNSDDDHGVCVCQGTWIGLQCEQCGFDVSTCYEPHTDTIASKSSCSGCVCLPGHFGPNCESSLIRGTISFVFGPDSDPPTPYQLSPLTDYNSDGSQFITKEGYNVVVRETASSLGVDQDLIEITNISQEVLIQPKMSSFLRSTSTTRTQTVISYNAVPTASGGNGYTDINQIGNAWSDLQRDFQDLPVGVTEVSPEIGFPNTISDPIYPEVKKCTDEERLTNGGVCPAPSKSADSTPIIVGVVVAVVVVALIFLVTILVVRWAKKNEKLCWAPVQKRSPDQSSNKNSVELTIGGSTTAVSNTTSVNSGNQSKSSSAVDLIEITNHGENLPSGWSKHQHITTGQVMYINQIELKSQKHSPLELGDDGNGW
jgi:hypothetical protein